MGTGTKIENSVIGLTHSLNEASGAITAHIENLKTPFSDMVNAFNNYSKETSKLTKGLVFWTKVMAIAIIVQVIIILVTTFFG